MKQIKKGEYQLNNLTATKNLAKELAKALNNQKEPIYILLSGDLGAGKTTLTKTLLKEFGIEEPVTSPTFVIINQYETKEGLIINHMDAYRLSKGEDLSMYEEYFAESKVNIIEWPSHLAINWDERPHLKIEIKIIDDNRRQLTIK